MSIGITGLLDAQTPTQEAQWTKSSLGTKDLSQAGQED